MVIKFENNFIRLIENQIINGELNNIINNKYYDYYYLEVPPNSDKIYFELTAENIQFFVLYKNDLNYLPNKENYDDKFRVYSKNMFEKKINCKYILIGIGTEFILNNYNPLYSIRVYFGKENDQKIFPLLTDRNNMCILNNKNYCNYFLQIDISDKIKKLDIYSEIIDIDYPDDIKIYSNIISINDFTNKEKLLQLIPTSSNYTYKNQLNNYLQINLENLLINENFIVLISIYSEKYSKKIVNLIPSYQNYFLKNILLQSNTPILVTSDINKEISIYTYTHENLFTYKVKRLKGDFKFNDKNSFMI